MGCGWHFAKINACIRSYSVTGKKSIPVAMAGPVDGSCTTTYSNSDHVRHCVHMCLSGIDTEFLSRGETIFCVC